jgi:hypothetical protein
MTPVAPCGITKTFRGQKLRGSVPTLAAIERRSLDPGGLIILLALGPAFFVTYGDTLLEVPTDRSSGAFCRPGAEAATTVLENQDRWETSNVSEVRGRGT